MHRALRFVAIILTLFGVFIFLLWLAQDGQPVWLCAVAAPTDLYDCFTATNRVWEPLTGLVLAVAGLAALLADSFVPGSQKSKEYNPTPEERRNNRKELIRRVREIWIDGYLNESLYQEVLLSLGMEWNAADPLPAPYGMKAKRQNHTPSLALAAGPHMATFYEQVNHQLLILGAPGAGKTTVMLDLAKSYLDRAEDDATVPVPVILTLSSWPGEETSFDDWLVSEMRVRHGNDITDKVARYWVEHNEVALFLDGLDELPAGRRGDAVAAVETYRNSTLARWFVVCSRSAEYGALANGFTELDSVEIEPVTPSQIQGYLAELDGEQPRQLAATIAGDAILQEVADTPLMLNVMLLAAGAIDWHTLPTGQSADVVRSFIYDAYVEEMLLRPRKGAQYTAVKTLTWLQWLAQKMVEHDQTVFLLERMNRSWFNQKWHSIVWVFTFGLIGGLIGGLLFGLIAAPFVALFSGLLFGRMFEFRDIDVQEHIRLKLTPEALFAWLAYGSMVMVGGELSGGLSSGLTFERFLLLTATLAVALTAALSGELLDSSSSLEQSFHNTQPNNAVRQSLRNGLLFGLLLGLLFGLIGGLILGLILGLSLGLSGGLEVVMKHYTLRLVLWSDGSMPLNYVRFLDTCADRILLRKVGGGYMFVHATFRDYFAALTPERIDELVQRIEARQES